MLRRFATMTSLLAVAACARGSGPAPTAPAGTAAATPRPAAAAPAEPTVQYMAGSHRYRIETQQHTEQEVMGNTNAFDATVLQLVSVTLVPQGGALGLTVVMDSTSLSTNAPGGDAAASAVRSLIGKRFIGTITPLGRVTALTSPDSSVREVQQALNGVRTFLPELPAGPIAAGREWVDTTSTTQAQEMFNMTTRAVRTHRIAGWESRDGARALHITTHSTYTVSGTGDAQGQPLELAGSGRAASDHFISAAGAYLGGTEADTTELNVNVVSAGMSIPVRRNQRATITRLP